MLSPCRRARSYGIACGFPYLRPLVGVFDGRALTRLLAIEALASGAVAASSNRPRSALCPVAARMLGAALFGMPLLCLPSAMAKSSR